DFDGPIVFPEHHESHAASAFYPSPFEDAAILTTDGVGEWATTSYGTGAGNRMRILGEIHFPHSLGLLYSAFTYFTGFKVNSGEYKLMGLAPYGEPRYVDLIYEHLIDVKDDGSFQLNMELFSFAHGLTMTSKPFARLFGGPPRTPEAPITQREMDLARSVQVVMEDILLRMARFVYAQTGQRNLCLAGGVALNCVANGRILREGPFDDIWIQPAAGDAGGALGAAYAAWHEYLDKPRVVYQSDAMGGSFLGPEFSDAEIEDVLRAHGVPYRRVFGDSKYVETARRLAEGKVVGWFQGRMEFGPRALGARSILADPRGRDVQKTVNLKIILPWCFQPFVPTSLRERMVEFFKLGHGRPYMLFVAAVTGASIGSVGVDKRDHVDSAFPAVIHVDGSARIQPVD